MGLAGPLKSLNVTTTNERTKSFSGKMAGPAGKQFLELTVLDSGSIMLVRNEASLQPLQQLILQFTTQLVSTPVPLERHV
jgi:hypothetical protein